MLDEVDKVVEEVLEEDAAEGDPVDEELVDEDVSEEDVEDVLNVLVVEDNGTPVTLYSDKPFGPPQICEPSAAQAILQRPSVTGAEPATRLLPQ